MSRPARIQRHVFVSLTLACTAAAWWGCATGGGTTTGTSSTSQGGSSGSGGSGGTGGIGGNDPTFDGGGGDAKADACTSTSAAAQRIKLDIVFLIDRSGSLDGPPWVGATTALKTFFNDPASVGIGAGIVYFPTEKDWDCNYKDYLGLKVPIAPLPGNAFALTNSMPAHATGNGTPTWAGLKGALMAATAYQDAHPTHKVIVVLATDGNTPDIQIDNVCSVVDNDITVLAKGALDYNGVNTYVIAMPGALIAKLDKIAAGGGTTAAYDVTQDISEFSAKMAEIRIAALGCAFDIPPPPSGMELVPGDVNFAYTPKGMGTPKLLPRADDLADCANQPGWYYDSNAAPTKMILCPASCATVQADTNAKVSVLFDCQSVAN